MYKKWNARFWRYKKYKYQLSILEHPFLIRAWSPSVKVNNAASYVVIIQIKEQNSRDKEGNCKKAMHLKGKRKLRDKR